jgi:hypothetical protein
MTLAVKGQYQLLALHIVRHRHSWRARCQLMKSNSEKSLYVHSFRLHLRTKVILAYFTLDLLLNISISIILWL